MGKTFIRTKEDFICEHCGAEVSGNGYTNHCPACLWSKHVDVHPGDRAASCGGMMRPLAVEERRGGYILTHECVVCGYRKRNTVSPKDSFEDVLRIVRENQ